MLCGCACCLGIGGALCGVAGAEVSVGAGGAAEVGGDATAAGALFLLSGFVAGSVFSGLGLGHVVGDAHSLHARVDSGLFYEFFEDISGLFDVGSPWWKAECKIQAFPDAVFDFGFVVASIQLVEEEKGWMVLVKRADIPGIHRQCGLLLYHHRMLEDRDSSTHD